MRSLPQSFTAGRELTLNGVTYAPGATIPNDVVANLKNASALLSRRWIIPNEDPQYRDKGPNTRPKPTRLYTVERQRLASGVAVPPRKKTTHGSAGT